MAARVVVRDVAAVCVVAQVGAVDAVAGVFEERVAFVVGVEQRGCRAWVVVARLRWLSSRSWRRRLMRCRCGIAGLRRDARG